MARLAFVLILALAASVISACAASAPASPQPTAGSVAPPDPQPSPGGTEHAIGSAAAPLTLEEYGDLQ